MKPARINESPALLLGLLCALAGCGEAPSLSESAACQIATKMVVEELSKYEPTKVSGCSDFSSMADRGEAEIKVSFTLAGSPIQYDATCVFRRVNQDWRGCYSRDQRS